MNIGYLPPGCKVLVDAAGIEGLRTSVVEGTVVWPTTGNRHLVRFETGGFAFVRSGDILSVGIPEGCYDNMRELLGGLQVVFFGNGEFALGPLRALVDAGCRCTIVTKTAPKKPTPVACFAKKHHLVILPWESLKPEQLLKADLGIVADFCKIHEEIFAVPKYGCINIHASLLPEYRGATPVQSVIRDGVATTGVTIIRMDDRIDHGNILQNLATSVHPSDNAISLRNKLSRLAGELLPFAVKLAAEGSDGICQEEFAELASPFIHPSATTKLQKSDMMIDWNAQAEAVARFIRANAPYAWTHWWRNGIRSRLIIIEAEPGSSEFGRGWPIGKIFSYDGKLYIACADHPLRVHTLKIEGSRAMAACDFLNGRAIWGSCAEPTSFVSKV